MGKGKYSDTVFLVDFGLCKSYRDTNYKHIVYKEGKSLIGTPRFCGLSAHLGIE